MGNASFKLVLYGWVVSVSCIGFGSNDVVVLCGCVWYVCCYVRKKAITASRDMGLYEVPLSMSLFAFGMGTMLVNFHICGINLRSLPSSVTLLCTIHNPNII